MVGDHMRSPRAVLQFSNLLRVATSGWVSMLGSTPRLAPSPRDITALFFRLLLKRTVLSQSEGPDDFYSPSASGRPLIGLVG